MSFASMRLGLFVHYMFVGRPYEWGATPWADGSPVASLDELADHLDVEELAQTAQAMRAQYVQFTTWHANMNALYPSEVLAHHLPGHRSRRDVIRDLLEVLTPRGIRLILYLHPSDGHDFSPDDQARVGWNDGAPFSRWNDFVNAVFAEVAARYGDDVAGYWIDGGLPSCLDLSRLRATLLRHHPGAWLIQNEGCNRALVDFGAREYFKEPYAATSWQMNAVISGEWWARQGFLHVSPEMALKYTALQASVRSAAGGVAWSAGPHPGGRWETGVREFFDRLGGYIDRIAPALWETQASVAYPTVEGTPLREARVAATESREGAVTFLHVLWPPRGAELTLPPPADGRRFASAALLDGSPVAWEQTPEGLRLRLPAGMDWDPVDTVIVLR